MSGCTWPLAGRLEGRTCGRDLVSPRSSFCAAHHTMNRETTMGRRDEEDELDEDLDEAEELEDDEDDEEPAPRRAAKAKAAPKAAKKARAQPSQKGVPKPSPAAVRALDLEIFSAADILEVSLGRTPTRAEIAAKAKVPGPTDKARRQRVSAAMRRRGLLDAPAKPAKAKAARSPRLAAPAPPAARPALAPTLIEALVAERARLAGIVARLDATIADLGGAS